MEDNEVIIQQGLFKLPWEPLSACFDLPRSHPFLPVVAPFSPHQNKAKLQFEHCNPRMNICVLTFAQIFIFNLSVSHTCLFCVCVHGW